MIFLWQILDIVKGISTKYRKNIGIRRAISSDIMLLQTLINVTSFLSISCLNNSDKNIV